MFVCVNDVQDRSHEHAMRFNKSELSVLLNRFTFLEWVVWMMMEHQWIKRERKQYSSTFFSFMWALRHQLDDGVGLMLYWEKKEESKFHAK